MDKLNIHKEVALLDIFVYREDDMRPMLESPIEQDGYICATDTHMAIRVKKEMLTGEYTKRESPDFARVFPASKPKYTIKFKAISEAIYMCGLDECIFVDCPECNGSGDVEWTYYDKEGDTHTHEDECPICGGDGMAFNGMNKFIFLDNEFAFPAYNFICITKAMRLLGVDSLTVTPNHANAWLFEPCKGVEIIVMPRSKHLSKVKASAKINLIKKTI